MTDLLPTEDLEKAYELIAQSIDKVGPAQESLFLSKLSLALAHQVAELERIEDSVRLAMKHLEGHSDTPE